MVPDTGLMDIADLKSKISINTAAVYFENPLFRWNETGAHEIVGLQKVMAR
ncbi:MAG: hypothetical protein CM1200mP8_3870 [Chloroflexota bacterium]|nr:MAG: hypothetical protein CM1200mP8_3870 [Chloroflexota bacterium]